LEQERAAKQSAERKQSEREEQQRLEAEKIAFEESIKLAQILDSNEKWADALKIEDVSAPAEDFTKTDLQENPKKELKKKIPKEDSPPKLFDEDQKDELGRLAREAVLLFEEQQATRKKLMQEMKGDPSVQVEKDSVVKESTSYESMTVIELKDALKKRGLKVTGKKAELIDRLKNS